MVFKTNQAILSIRYGLQLWHQKGKLHRTDSPAIIRPNGYRFWWLDGNLVKASQ